MSEHFALKKQNASPAVWHLFAMVGQSTANIAYCGHSASDTGETWQQYPDHPPYDETCHRCLARVSEETRGHFPS